MLTLTTECAATLGLPRAPAIRRGDVPVPITWGLRRPVVLLPDAADTWPEGRLRAVLLHELAHIRRRDWAAHRLADLTCALYWFHPLVWLTARRLRDESELACDDLVLSCGVPAPDYARHLLDIARALSPAAPPAPTGAIGMARTARVEGRITQMLNPTQNRRALTRRALVGSLVAVALGVAALAALRPAAQAASRRPHGFNIHAVAVALPVVMKVQRTLGVGVAVSAGPSPTLNAARLLAGVNAWQKSGQWWSGGALPQPTLAVQKPLFSAIKRPLRKKPAPKWPVPKQTATPPPPKADAEVPAVWAVPAGFATMSFVDEGHSLTPEAAAAQEKVLAAHPDDPAAHGRLLGYYSATRFDVPWLHSAAYAQQIFWFIRNDPEEPFFWGEPNVLLLRRDNPAGFEQGKTLWLKQIAAHPSRTAILSNAAKYCLQSDDETAERLLRRAETLEPNNPDWPQQLGQLYELQSTMHSSVRPEPARKALAEYEAAFNLSTSDITKDFLLTNLATTAYNAGEYDKARRYASKLLALAQQLAQSGEPDYFKRGDKATYTANLVVGRLALRDGRPAEAEACLLTMGRLFSSSIKSAFGPNMSLARDLLLAGRRDAALGYLDECGKVWNDPALAEWRSAIQQGKTPDFGANLDY